MRQTPHGRMVYVRLLTVPLIALGAWSMALVLWQPPEYYYYCTHQHSLNKVGGGGTFVHTRFFVDPVFTSIHTHVCHFCKKKGNLAKMCHKKGRGSKLKNK